MSACPAMNALRGKRIVAPPSAQRMPIIMGPTRKDAGRANRSSTRARISDAPTAAAHCRAGRIDPKVHLLPSRSCRARGFEAPVNPSLLGVLCDPGLNRNQLVCWGERACEAEPGNLACEAAGLGFGRGASKMVWAEILVEGAVAKHVIISPIW